MTAAAIVEMRGIVKRFPGVAANDGASFDLRAGEVHALLGENGAGKSTLMNILSGIYRPDAGEIFLRGRPERLRSPGDAISLGIGMIHQHFRLVPTFTVTENIILGMPKPAFRLPMRRLESEVEAFSRDRGLPVDPRALIWQLSVGEQQRVEILKMLYRGAGVLIMDEPTAVLTPREVGDLFRVMRQMAASGRSIVFISHKLTEVLDIADRITVMRAGKNVSTLDRSDAAERGLAALMVGDEETPEAAWPPAGTGEVVLEMTGVRALGERGEPALRGVSLTVRAGEIVGIAGVAGNGQRELAEAICGLRPISEGTIRVSGEDVTGAHPLRAIEAGAGFVPEERLGVGLAPGLSVAENLTLRAYRRAPVGGVFLVDWKAARKRSAELVRTFDIRTPSVETPARALSGGNAQKLLLARETDPPPKLLVAAHPTRGLDVRATESVHRILGERRAAGTAVLLISGDLDEILRLSDRVAVIFEGRIAGEFRRGEISAEDIGLRMGGAKPGANEHDQN